MKAPEADRTADLFDRIRSACRSVAEHASAVHVRHDRIAAYAAEIAPVEPPPLDARVHVVGKEQETLAYFVTLGAVNFGSGYFPYLKKRQGGSGYVTLASALSDRFRRSGPLSAKELRTMTPQQCAELFGQEMAVFPIREVMELYARALRGLGDHLARAYGGRFDALISAAGHSAVRLIDILREQPFFRDEPPYGEIRVPLYKRAQLLVSDLATAFGGRGPGRFDDLDRLTIFADNLVPHVLRVDGLLHYSEGLAGRIERGELIRAGSSEEVEIRACAVDCVERIAEVSATLGCPASPRRLDAVLWSRGQRRDIKRFPRHRTRTVFY